MLTLFRMSTGESWQAIMQDCERQQSYVYECIVGKNYKFLDENGEPNPQSCGSKSAKFYFVTFMIMVSFVFFNLFIAIILESFNSSQAEFGLKVGQNTMNSFNDIWCDDDFDPKGKGFIKVATLPKLIERIVDAEIEERYEFKQALMNGEIDIEE